MGEIQKNEAGRQCSHWIRARRSFLLVILASLLPIPPVNAMELDVILNDQERQNLVTPICAQILLQTQAVLTRTAYHQALCRLYGIGSTVQMDQATELLRKAAGDGLVEAQLALADTLQKDNEPAQREALQWYARAAAQDDARATLRLSRLVLRLQPPVAQPDLAQEPVGSSGLEPTTGRKLPPGYHCHIYGRGEKMCHGGMYH